METTLRIVNKSNYFRSFDRIYNVVSNPVSYSFQKQKRDGYAVRLQYEYESCKSHGGFACFLTLTYNDRNVPRQLGLPCFSYQDIRLITHGKLGRYAAQHGAAMSYFISCELGSGAGIRGIDNNPHYHCLFFFSPKSDQRFDLSSSDVERVVKEIWMGFDDSKLFRPYSQATKGIVRAGKFGVEVTNFRALSYCAKYVVKNDAIKTLEEKYNQRLWASNPPSYEGYVDFCDSIGVLPDFHWFLDVASGEVSQPSDSCDLSPLEIDDFDEWLKSDSLESQVYYSHWLNSTREKVAHELRLFRNVHGDKVRISHGVGAAALDFIVNEDSKPAVKMPTKNGFVNRSIPLFLFRKKYCDVVKDNNGNNRYVLNDFGLRLRKNNFESQVSKVYDSAVHALDIYNQCRSHFAFDLSGVDESVLYKYSVFNVVYSFRRFDPSDHSLSHDLDPFADYCRFIQPARSQEWNPFNPFLSRINSQPDFLWYDEHPYFKDCSFYFDYIDYILDQLAEASDLKNKEAYEEKERVKKVFNSILYVH